MPPTISLFDSSGPSEITHELEVLDRHCADVGRDQVRIGPRPDDAVARTERAVTEVLPRLRDIG